MPLLSKVGRKSFRTRLLVALLYALLLAGAVAMLYPLGLMLAGSTQSVADLHENRLVPRFLVSDEALWQKYLEALFNESLDALNIAFRTDYPSFNAIPLPPPGAAPHAEWLPAYHRFLQDTPLPPTSITLGHYWAPQAGAFPAALRAFRRHLREKYGTLDALNAALRTDFDAWYNVFVQHLYLIHTLQIHTAIAAELAGKLCIHLWHTPFNVQLEAAKLLLGLDVTCLLVHSYHTVMYIPSCSFTLGVLPCREVLAIEEYNGIRRRTVCSRITRSHNLRLWCPIL